MINLTDKEKADPPPPRSSRAALSGFRQLQLYFACIEFTGRWMQYFVRSVPSEKRPVHWNSELYFACFALMVLRKLVNLFSEKYKSKISGKVTREALLEMQPQPFKQSLLVCEEQFKEAFESFNEVILYVYSINSIFC